MKEPTGEYVGLDFYFGDRDCPDALRDVVMHCIQNGATFSGELLISEFDGARAAAFEHIYSNPVVVHRLNKDELPTQLEKDNVHVAKVGLWNAIGISKGNPEIVTFNGVSPQASNLDTNAISIVGEGWEFSTPGYEKEANKKAQRCFHTFLRVCNGLEPHYAAILNEDSLSCRYDLQRGTGTECFCNFFVSERQYGRATLDAIEAKYSDAYTERSNAGLYVATWLFSPKKLNVDRSEAKKRSREVAQLITR
jgi:hypothetical protein